MLHGRGRGERNRAEGRPSAERWSIAKVEAEASFAEVGAEIEVEEY
jgi:hypothetical protein